MLTITDSPKMVEIDPESVSVVGDYKFDDQLEGKVAILSSAHPVPMPGTNNWVNWVSNIDVVHDTAALSLFTLGGDDPKNRKKIRNDVVMDTQPYMHSFGITSKHVVYPRMPIKFETTKMLSEGVAHAFQPIDLTAPGKDNGFHIIPLDGSDPIVKALPVDDKLYFTHTINTYENETGIVIDLAVAIANPFTANLTVTHFKDKAARDATKLTDHNVIKRFHLPLDDKPITTEILSDPKVGSDFSKASPKVNGVKHCFFWTVQWFSDGVTNADMAIAKYDVCDGNKKVQWRRQHWYPSEATFIPSEEPGAAEDDGLVVFTALDGEKEETWLIVADGKTMESVSEVGPFPRIGFTTHGEFFPSASSKVSAGLTYV
jgi:carotenoid cleavage dioxygenase-like enzyme